jgi:hypothetical protein
MNDLEYKITRRGRVIVLKMVRRGLLALQVNILDVTIPGPKFLGGLPIP